MTDLQKGLLVTPQFQPGFRISTLDILVLVIGIGSAVAVWQAIWWVGFVILFVLAHFFLFCNVFRVSRVPELVWACLFVLLAAATILADVPGWVGTIVASLALTIVLIVREIRLPSYHGIAWRHWNPGLPEWWESFVVSRKDRAE